MSQLDRGLLRRLAEWPTGGAPVYSLYLDVDGRRYPRRKDYVARAMELCRSMGERSTTFVREDVASDHPLRDTSRIMLFLEREFERGATRGVAVFSCARAGLWEVVAVARPLPDRAAVADAPYLLPLEALVETYESFCTVLVDRSRARIFLVELGTVEERCEARRERQVVEHLLAEAAAGRGAVVGLADTLAALAQGRVRTLVVPLAREIAGIRCSACGRLDAAGDRCPTCGAQVHPVP